MKKIFLIILLLFLFLPNLVWAQNKDQAFKARVLEVVQEDNLVMDGRDIAQQNLRLVGLDSGFEGVEFVFRGINEFDVVNKRLYRAGDTVMAAASYDDQDNINYYVIDYYRNHALLWIFIIFVLSLLLVGGIKSFRSLLSLAITFFVVVQFILPAILKGLDPVLVTLLGSLIILILAIYLTEGINLRSHISVLSIALSLGAVIIFSYIFVHVSRLSGLASEEVSFLFSLGYHDIDFQGLLLAGIIIGALGVLDDVVISQVSAVEQILETDKSQSYSSVFSRAYKIGVSHISSMTNTLFLAYTGASLPLLILFVSGQSAFSSWGQIVNNELIAVEVVRTLGGSVGLILAVPIATFIAAYWFKKRK